MFTQVETHNKSKYKQSETVNKVKHIQMTNYD